MKRILLVLIFVLPIGIYAQSITSVTPNAGNLGQTLNVGISGDNVDFYPISAPENISFYNSASEHLFIDNVSEAWFDYLNVKVTIPSYVSTGSYHLVITDPSDGQQYLLNNAFTVMDNYNTISGNVAVDVNSNGCDAADLRMAGIKVSLYNGVSTSYTFTDNDGNYEFRVGVGTFTITVLPEIPLYTASPTSSSVSFASEGGFTESRDFCLTTSTAVNDLEVEILPGLVARPGFDALYLIYYKNSGNQILSGTLNFSYDDTRVDFVSAVPAPASQTSGNLSFNYSDLYPFSGDYITLIMNVNSPMETPPVNNGDTLLYTLSGTPTAGDATPANNEDMFNQVVVGSYDPNDKLVAEGSQIHVSEVGEYLHYVIRFQNTGTFAAENVRIVDDLAWNLDRSTLQMMASSHECRTTLTGGQIDFWFDNINLPPQSEDDAGSNGFVAFKIKPAAFVGLGHTMRNTAEIYFDFNFPIITNTVATSVTALGTNTAETTDIVVYPNPTTGLLNIETESGVEVKQIRVLDLNGRIVFSSSANLPVATVDISHLQSGIYLLQAQSDQGRQRFRIIKE